MLKDMKVYAMDNETKASLKGFKADDWFENPPIMESFEMNGEKNYLGDGNKVEPLLVPTNQLPLSSPPMIVKHTKKKRTNLQVKIRKDKENQMRRIMAGWKGFLFLFLG
ncbi:hypothetical protein ACE6H2_020532 [Prunus campanulata]